MRPTSHRRGVAGGALAAAVLLAVTATTAPATAADPAPAAEPAAARTGALPADVSPAQRAALIRAAEAKTGSVAAELGLGEKERLLVRDVVKDRDGTLHTRYERTWAGLPVLGGDPVVAAAPHSTPATVHNASHHAPQGTAPEEETAPS
ncbi:M4 family metallopeptidase, partial [Streptomyces diastaticus]